MSSRELSEPTRRRAHLTAVRHPTDGPVHAQIANWCTDGDVDVRTHDGPGIEVTTTPPAGVSARPVPQTRQSYLDDQGAFLGSLPVFNVRIQPLPGHAGPVDVQVSLPRGSGVSLALEGGGHSFDAVNLLRAELDPESPSTRDARQREESAARALTRPLPGPQPAPPPEPVAPAEPVDLSAAPPATQTVAAEGPVYLEAVNNTPHGALRLGTHDGNGVVVTAPEGAAVFAYQVPQTYHTAAMLPVHRVRVDSLPGSDQPVDVKVSVPRGSAVRAGTTDGGQLDVDTGHLSDFTFAGPRPTAVQAAGQAWGQVPDAPSSTEPPSGESPATTRGAEDQRRVRRHR